ncbi:cytochrome c [bacterium]|nr:cytochrome c [bacterium]
MIQIAKRTLGILICLGISSNLSHSEDLSKGKSLYMSCIPCHGKQGEGNKSMNAPRLSGQEKWYLISSLKQFKTKLRGYHQKDIPGKQMQSMTVFLPTARSINNVVAYISTLKNESKIDQIEGDPIKGKSFYQICISCHGEDGSGKELMSAPKLKDQHGWYLKKQLLNFKNRLRGTKEADKLGAQMLFMSQTLKDEQAVSDVVAYIQSLE